MKNLGGWYYTWLILIGFWLVACGQNVTATPTFSNPPPTPPPTLTTTPNFTATPTPLTLASVRADDWDFSLDLPTNWVVADPVLIPLGQLYQIGEAPLGPGPYSSSLILADPAVWSPTAAARLLACGEGCNDPVVFTEVVVGTDLPVTALTTIIGKESLTPLEWYFIPFQDKLIITTLHDAETLQTLPDVIATFKFTPIATVTPTQTATQPPTATPTASRTPIPTAPPLATSTSVVAATAVATETALPTASPTATPTTGVTTTPVTLPLDRAIAFLQSLVEDSTGNSSLLFLSDQLRETVRDGESLVSLMSLGRRILNFDVVWVGNQNGTIQIEATLDFGSDRPSETRLLTLIYEAEAWRVNSVE